MRIANILAEGTTGFDPPEALVGADVSVEIVGMPFQVHPANEVDMLLTEAAVTDAAIRAEDQGFDAVFINSVGDCGLRPARAAVRIPVVGAGQASMSLAAQLGNRFGLVSVWPESAREVHLTQLRDYQLVDRCGSMRFVAAEEEMADLEEESGAPNFYVGMRDREARMIDRILGEIEYAIEQDGCDVIVLGCTCMDPVAEELAQRVEVPVINPLAAGFAVTELMARLSLAHSSVAFRPSPIRRTEVLQSLVAATGAALSASTEDEEDCGPYCAIPRQDTQKEISSAVAAGVG